MKTHKLHSGFGLVEIMIAMLIGLFLMGGLIQMFITSKQTYKMQDTVGRLQENQRFAMDFLVHDMRGVSGWGCFRDPKLVENLSGIANATIGIQGTDGGATGTDSITLNSTSALQDNTGADVKLTAIPVDPTANLVVSGNSGVSLNDIVLIGDCSDASLFQVTGLTKGATDSIAHTATFKKAYDTTARLYKFSSVTYSIQQGTRGTAGLTDQLSLFKNINGTDTELIEGVEDMQILYGEDNDAIPDGSPNYYVPADQVVNMDNVVSIQVSLLLRSLDPTSPPVIYNFNNRAFPAACPINPQRCYMRRSMTSVITVRNRLY